MEEKMNGKIGLQLYSLKEIMNKDNFVEVLQKIKSYGYEGIEGVERDNDPDTVHLFCFIYGFPDFFKIAGECYPFVHSEFAAEQIHGLNTVRAFIDHKNPAVPHQLFRGIFLNITVTAENLDTVTGDFKCLVGYVSFNDGR